MGWHHLLWQQKVERGLVARMLVLTIRSVDKKHSPWCCNQGHDYSWHPMTVNQVEWLWTIHVSYIRKWFWVDIYCYLRPSPVFSRPLTSPKQHLHFDTPVCCIWLNPVAACSHFKDWSIGGIKHNQEHSMSNWSRANKPPQGKCEYVNHYYHHLLGGRWHVINVLSYSWLIWILLS